MKALRNNSATALEGDTYDTKREMGDSEYYFRTFGRMAFWGNLVSDRFVLAFDLHRETGGEVLLFDCPICGQTIRKGNCNNGRL